MMRAFLIVLALFGASETAAQTSGLRELDTEYSAKIWRAVGRIDFAGGQAHCSGTLIAPDLVLTAAHCLYRGETNKLYDPSDIVFRAGVRDGRAEATRGVKAAAAHQGFDPLESMSVKNIRNDVALLRLDKPISSFDIPSFKLHTERVEVGPVSVVSYGRGRMNTQSQQKQCQLLETASDLMFFDCNSVPGTSGAPVFTHKNGRGQIVSVISGRIETDAVQRTVGMALPARVNDLRKQLRMEVRGPVAKVRRLGVGQRASGAKFVRADGS